MLLTPLQINRLDKAQVERRRAQIRMSARHVAKNAPHPRFLEGDGLFLKHGNNISDGAGLLTGKNSPFKNILVLGWIL